MRKQALEVPTCRQRQAHQRWTDMFRGGHRDPLLPTAGPGSRNGGSFGNGRRSHPARPPLSKSFIATAVWATVSGRSISSLVVAVYCRLSAQVWRLRPAVWRHSLFRYLRFVVLLVGMMAMMTNRTRFLRCDVGVFFD